MGGPNAHEKKYFRHTQKLTVNLPPGILQEDLKPLIKVTVHQGKGNSWTARGVLGTGLEITNPD